MPANHGHYNYGVNMSDTDASVFFLRVFRHGADELRKDFETVPVSCSVFVRVISCELVVPASQPTT